MRRHFFLSIFLFFLNLFNAYALEECVVCSLKQVEKFCNEVQFDDFSAYQKKFSKEFVLEKIHRYLQKDPSLENYYMVTEEGLHFFSSPEDKVLGNSEYTLFFGKDDVCSTVVKSIKEGNKPFEGFRIALDPGHFGGDLAFVEDRFIDMLPVCEIGEREGIQFNEGTLTLLTAKVLKELLESSGAEVFLTRNSLAKGAVDLSFDEWLEKVYQKGKKSELDLSSKKKKFRSQYNALDLKVRAQKINAFQPDVTLFIHYNSHKAEDKETGKTKVTPENYNMAFIGGAFMEGELKQKRDRYEFLRLIVSDDLEKSAILSKFVVEEFQKQLAVGIIGENKETSYLEKSCIQVSEGVFSRNLALTRLVHGVLCYGESLCQNNEQECLRLNNCEVVIDGIKGPKRVLQVAKAYYNGLLAFYQK